MVVLSELREGGEAMGMLSAQADELRTLADKLRCVRFDGEAALLEWLRGESDG